MSSRRLMSSMRKMELKSKIIKTSPRFSNSSIKKMRISLLSINLGVIPRKLPHNSRT
jgi:hypothetical protein